ncbi:MAG: hypothetical protein KatS3mg031_2959 [Chitinophagales bacterium]|nr:MAG: hypothetical protein KatS3mg031_2959 [Chitinophagales bacterium]
MKQEFIKKWSRWWAPQKDKEELTNTFERELDALIDYEIRSKNLVKIDFANQFVCDRCGCHPTVLYYTKRGRFCIDCKPVK